MPSKNPRVNAVLEEPLFRAVQVLARREGVSLSQKVRDLVREAVELAEDEGSRRSSKRADPPRAAAGSVMRKSGSA